MAADGDAPEYGGGGVEYQGVTGVHAGEQAAGEAVGERGLADAGCAGDEPGVVHASAEHGFEDLGLGRAWPNRKGFSRGSGAVIGC